MFYVLSKTLDLLLTPLAWALITAVVVGLRWLGCDAQEAGPPSRWRVVCARLWPHRGRPLRRFADRTAGALFVLSFFGLWFCSQEPVGNMLLRQTEIDAPDTVREGHTYDVVVLLGGLVEDRVEARHGISYNDESERLLGAFEVYTRGQARNILVSGGSRDEQLSEARILADELLRMGVPEAHVWVEGESRNTAENAKFSAAILRERQVSSVLLLTSAFHMERALGSFHQVGIEADAMPVGFKSYDPARFSGIWLPRSRSLYDSSMALRELAGRVVYRWTGR